MIDREKTIRNLETIGAWHTHHYEPFHYECAEAIHDALQLLKGQDVLMKEQDARYKEMVVEWLREMAHNNYQETKKMDFLDAILEIRERAMTGLENYFKDYKNGKAVKKDENRQI